MLNNRQQGDDYKTASQECRQRQPVMRSTYATENLQTNWHATVEIATLNKLSNARQKLSELA